MELAKWRDTKELDYFCFQSSIQSLDFFFFLSKLCGEICGMLEFNRSGFKYHFSHLLVVCLLESFTAVYLSAYISSAFKICKILLIM